MSYPRQITVVAVEDELPMKQRYEQIFQEHEQSGRTAPLKILGSLEEAIALLSGETIVHLLLLDLGLPVPPRGTAEAGVDPGVRLLTAAASRDHLPIPAVLVVSGRMGQASQLDLQEQIRTFWYARALTKSVDDEEMAVRIALDKIDQYTGIGIHIRDGGRPSPTLSPREDDLLRRCAIEKRAIGLDLRWWGDYPARMTAVTGGESRVLAGEFLLDRGMGSSRRTFFKFEPPENATWVHRDADVMNHKLQHVKVVSSMSVSSRALLATQTVATSTGQLVSLQDLLRRPSSEVLPLLPEIVRDVHYQLDQLGTRENAEHRVSDLIWRYHDRSRIDAMWERFCGPAFAQDFDPAALLDELREDQTTVWVEERLCNHGDLNPTNIAVEILEAGAKAYIFDAGGVHKDAALRDLAYLEVTSLLHQRAGEPRGLVERCASLYGQGPADKEHHDDVSSCIRHLIEAIRQSVVGSELRVYSILVLDAALQQLGGLAFDANNKISDANEAIRLVVHAAGWYRHHSLQS